MKRRSSRRRSAEWKTDKGLLAGVRSGYEWLVTPHAPPIQSVLPDDEDLASAFVIGAWCGYWGGQSNVPSAVRKTRGKRRFKIRGRGYDGVVSAIDPTDHRDGVAWIGEQFG